MVGRKAFLYNALIWTERKLSRNPAGKLLKKIRPAVSAYRHLYKTATPSETIVTTIRGHRVHLDPADPDICRHVLLDEGSWEPKQTEVFLAFVRPGMVVVDVGANFGHYTLLAARAVGEKGKVYAFEPCPRNYTMLARNVRENNYAYVETVPKAVSNRGGTAKLYLSARSSGGHKLAEGLGRGAFVEVETVSLDDYFREVSGGIDVLKLDTEGAEDLILDGMRVVLGSSPNMVLFTEFYPNAMRAFGRIPEGYIRRLLDYGFRIRALDEDRGTEFPVGMSDVPDLVEALSREGAPRDVINLVCVRGQQSERRPAYNGAPDGASVSA
jgi:FkbM family methyltransferase